MAPRSYFALTFALTLGSSLACAGCFEVRPLDRRFDAEVDAAPQVDAGAEVGPPPQCAEIDKSCDGVDDDCDGRYDEDFAEAEACGIGQCRAGSTPARCVSGFPIDCLPGPAGDEQCDGLDNDCDGVLDEGLTRNCGADPEGICTRGTIRCEDGRWTECDGIEPGVESCDGRDEDCDGQTDEGLTRACDGAGLCGEGVELCRDGQWQGCDAMEAAPESCNGIDDDCDGVVDEDLRSRACGSNEGACRAGEQVCTDGDWGPCNGGVQPAPVDSCDGTDDDCDGAVDEGEGPCGACGLASRPICPVGWDPCPAAPPFTACIRELARVEADIGERIGERIQAAGDLDGDGIEDFVTAGNRRIVALSGADGGELWDRNTVVDEVGALAAADFDGDGAREVLVGDVDSPRGAVQFLASDGGRQGRVVGDDVFELGVVLAADDGEDVFAAGDPTANGGAGLVRLLRYVDGMAAPAPVDIGLRNSAAFGAALAAGRDAAGVAVLAVTEGPEQNRRVVRVPKRVLQPDEQVLEVLPPGQGVGAALVLGVFAPELPPAVAALNASQPWLDLAALPEGPDEQVTIRLPLDGVGSDVALIPGDALRPALLAVAHHDGVRLLRIGPEGTASLVEFELPGDLRAQLQNNGPVVAGALRGPDGSRLLALGLHGELPVAGRVVIYRLD